MSRSRSRPSTTTATTATPTTTRSRGVNHRKTEESLTMLRYNNQGVMHKPVDFYRPLTVDVSVEYELPKEVAPPPGSAPLLIIHPSAYFRSSSSKLSQPQPVPLLASSQKSSVGSQSSTTTTTAAAAVGAGGAATTRSSSTRLAELNSTLYYLRSTTSGNNGSQTHNQNQLTSNHILNGKSLRSYGNVSSTSNSSLISRSRSVTMGNSESRASTSITSNCPYGKCDECSSGSGRSTIGTHNNRVSSTIKKIASSHSHHPHLAQTHPADPFYYNGNVGGSSSGGGNNSLSNNVHGSGSNSTSTNLAVSTASGMLGMDYGVSLAGSSSTITTSGKASNKRLRMMSQQHTMHNPPTQPMEPLNLAVTPSALNSSLNPSSSSSSSSYHQTNNNQFSTFFNKSSLSSNANASTTSSHHGLGLMALSLNYGSTFPNNHRGSNPTAPSNLYSAQSARYPKECPVPVDKGSGSDSGVCSENDSDVSPPMAPFSGHTRRSILTQDLSNSGCYCCCCPTTSSSSSRKSSSSSINSKGKSSFGKSVHSSSSNSTGSFSNYTSSVNSSNILGMMAMQEGQLDMDSISIGNTPMDSSTYRKWFVGDTVNTSSLGRWFQV